MKLKQQQTIKFKFNHLKYSQQAAARACDESTTTHMPCVSLAEGECLLYTAKMENFLQLTYQNMRYTIRKAFKIKIKWHTWFFD